MKSTLRILPLCLLALSAPAQAAGFYLQEQSASNQGLAYAGAGANPEDASTLFYNPAGITELSGREALANASAIRPQAKFHDTGTTAGLAGGGLAALGGNDGGAPYGTTVLPDIYLASPLPDSRYWVGLSVTSPFGLSNNYSPGWFGRYDSTKSVLQVLDVSPVLSAHITDHLSIGGGPDFQRASGSLQSALPCPNAGFGCGAAFSPATDGLSRLDGASWALGYNLGALWDVTPSTKIGAFYRSAITQNLRGTAGVSGLTGALAGQNGVQEAQAKLKLPDIATLNVAHAASGRLTLLGSASWYGWSNFNQIDVKLASGAPDNVTPENYNDSYSLNAGAEWKQTENLKLRLGTQFDETPTSDARTTRTPDASRLWLSAGAGYAVNAAFSIDAAVSHIFMGSSSVNIVKSIYGGTGAASTVDINGKATGDSINIVSLEAAVRF